MVAATPLWRSKRLIVAIVVFLCMLLNYAQRTSLSIAIVAMVNHTAVAIKENRNVTIDYKQASQDGPFLWDKTKQGHILGAFYYGYLVSQIPSGLLSEKYGTVSVYLWSMVLAGVPTLLTPFASHYSYYTLLFFRFLVGLGSGSVYPCMHTLWSNWAPPLERSMLTGFSYAGTFMGNVVAMPISGYLCTYGFAGGWPSVFYVFGGITVALIAFWYFLVCDSPRTDSMITKNEKEYIVESLKKEMGTVKVKAKDMPWGKILTSVPLWGILFSNITSDWGLYLMMTNMPTYIRDVLKFDIESNGYISALPYIGLWMNMNLTACTADYLRDRRFLNTTWTRKLFNFIGQMGSAVFLILLSFQDENSSSTAVFMLTMAVSISGSAYSGFLINHIDLAPRFAGTLLGMTNGIASVTGFIAPAVVAAITTNSTREEWQMVMFLTAAIYAFGAISYCIMGSGEIQDWAVPASNNEPVEEQNQLTGADVNYAENTNGSINKQYTGYSGWYEPGTKAHEEGAIMGEKQSAPV